VIGGKRAALDPAFGRGARLGATLAGLYILLLALPTAVSLLAEGLVCSAFLLVALYLGVGSVLGVLPALVLGGVTAEILADLLSRQPAITRWRAALVGASVCLLLVLLVSLTFWGGVALFLARSSADLPGYWPAYLWCVGLPALLFVPAGAWAAQHWRGSEAGQRSALTTDDA
jgi:hypothetical protein